PTGLHPAAGERAVSDAACRITVVGRGRRADLTLPADVPVAELVPQLVQLLEGEPAAGSPPQRWSLLGVGGLEVGPDRSLGEQSIPDGAMLFLRDTTVPPPEPVIEDVVEAVAIEVEVRRGRWSADAARALWLAAATACMAGAAWVAWLTPARGLGVGMGLAGGLLAAGGGVLLRAVRQPLPGTVLALTGLPLWGAGGAAAAVLAGGRPGALAGAAAGVVVGALAAGLTGRAAVGPVGAALLASAPLAVIAGIGASLGAGLAEQAAVLVVAWLALADRLPGLARLAAGLSVREGDAGGSGAALRDR